MIGGAGTGRKSAANPPLTMRSSGNRRTRRIFINNLEGGPADRSLYRLSGKWNILRITTVVGGAFGHKDWLSGTAFPYQQWSHDFPIAGGTPFEWRRWPGVGVGVPHSQTCCANSLGRTPPHPPLSRRNRSLRSNRGRTLPNSSVGTQALVDTPPNARGVGAGMSHKASLRSMFERLRHPRAHPGNRCHGKAVPPSQ